MKKVFLFVLLGIFILGASAWSDASVEDEIKAKAKPVVQRFFDALKAKDYEGMRQDFSNKMIKTISADQFEKSDKEDIAKYGELVSWEYSGWMREGGFDIVLVQTKSVKGDLAQYKFVFMEGPEGKKISGLWIKPLPKGLSKIETDAYLNMFGEIAECHLKAIKKKDYEMASKDFSAKMLEVLGPDKLKKSVGDENSLEMGELDSWKFDYAKRAGEHVIFYYQATYSKGETMSYQVVFKDDTKDKKIIGLWLKPLGVE